MTVFEYKVIPAPAKGHKAPGVKGAEARFAHTLETEINRLAAEGWEYVRSDILPSQERQGLTSSHIVYRSVLVFRRILSPTEPSETAANAAQDTKPHDSVVETETTPDDITGDETPPADTAHAR